MRAAGALIAERLRSISGSLASIGRRATRMACTCALLAGCATPPPELVEDDLYVAALDRWLERTVQLQRIHHRMRTGNAELCGDEVSPALGIVVVRTEELPASLRTVGAQRFGWNTSPTVIAVLPGSAAEAARIEVGDRVLRVGSRRVSSTRSIYAPPRRRAGQITLRIERGEELLSFDVENKLGCDYRAELVDSDDLNAFAVKRKILVLSGLMRILKEDSAIAFVMGHELAHHIAFKTTGRRSRSVADEVRADYLGVYLAERSGYALSLSDFGLARAARASATRRGAIGSTHPPYPERSVYFAQALAEVAGKRARGEVLIPRPVL
jgi:hypothetical protein